MLSRRNFLNSTLGVGMALATQGAHETAAQAPVAPARKRTIVDAQIHLWKAESDRLEMGARVPSRRCPSRSPSSGRWH